MRNQELIGTMCHDPRAYHQAEQVERLTEQDKKRWPVPMSAADHQVQAHYPVPAFIDIRKPSSTPTKALSKIKKPADLENDLFGFDMQDHSALNSQDVFVAFALYVDDRLGQYGHVSFTPGVYWQELITLSTSLVGIKSSLATYYQFKTTTYSPICDVEDMKIVIAQIRFKEGTVDTNPPGKESYTWKPTIAYQQLRHLVKHSQVTLEHADLNRQYKDAVSLMRNAQNIDEAKDAAFEVRDLKQALRKMPPASGDLVWEGLYQPSVKAQKGIQMELTGVSASSKRQPARENLEFDEVPMACIACSV